MGARKSSCSVWAPHFCPMPGLLMFMAVGLLECRVFWCLHTISRFSGQNKRVFVCCEQCFCDDANSRLCLHWTVGGGGRDIGLWAASKRPDLRGAHLAPYTVGAGVKRLGLATLLILGHLTPNGHYMGRTAQLTSRYCILYIYSTNIRIEYFKHAA